MLYTAWLLLTDNGISGYTECDPEGWEMHSGGRTLGNLCDNGHLIIVEETALSLEEMTAFRWSDPGVPAHFEKSIWPKCPITGKNHDQYWDWCFDCIQA